MVITITKNSGSGDELIVLAEGIKRQVSGQPAKTFLVKIAVPAAGSVHIIFPEQGIRRLVSHIPEKRAR